MYQDKVKVFKNELCNLKPYKNAYTYEVDLVKTINKLNIDDADDQDKLDKILQPFNHTLKQVSNELDGVFTKLRGVKAIRYDVEPSSHDEHLQEQMKLDLVDKYNELLKTRKIEIMRTIIFLNQDIERLKNNIEYIESILNKLDDESREYCIRIIVNEETNEKVGNDVGYSKTGIWKKVESSLEKVL